MAERKQHFTESGYQACVEELDYLKNKRRQEVKDALALARSYGDLSENSEYDEAKDEQAKVESRISELEEILNSAIVVKEEEVDTSVISLGAHVTVLNKTFDEQIEYDIVGSNEADAFAGKISDQSPIGAALMGKRVDDTVTVATPNGSHMVLLVLDVERTKDI
ncbi:MAG: transcription elongation factor GreA [Clostridiales bacterium]|nr:transcription elongation factor GreA [Clostridia bacterium]MCD8003339.1 transcription elongation factor GreA [Clostridia bacterium]MCD8055886.1 transcription elongation factor GreA [Clostridiales bacterium]